MCQQIVFGTDYGTRKFDLGSGAAFLCKKSLFYGPVESYFAAYDSVVLTGPSCEGLLIYSRRGRQGREAKKMSHSVDARRGKAYDATHLPEHISF